MGVVVMKVVFWGVEKKKPFPERKGVTFLHRIRNRRASERLRVESDDGVLLVEADVVEHDVFEQRARLRGAAEGQQYAVVGQRLYQFAAGAGAGHVEGLAHHEVDAGAAVVAEVDVAALDAVDRKVEADAGVAEEHVDVVTDAHGMRAAVHHGQGASGFLLNQFADFAVCESQFHVVVCVV